MRPTEAAFEKGSKCAQHHRVELNIESQKCRKSENQNMPSETKTRPGTKKITLPNFGRRVAKERGLSFKFAGNGVSGGNERGGEREDCTVYHKQTDEKPCPQEKETGRGGSSQ